MGGEQGSHTDGYFEYLLGDLGYKSDDMFIVRQMCIHRFPPHMNDLALKSYNIMHAGYHMQVEWDIGVTRCLVVIRCFDELFLWCCLNFYHAYENGNYCSLSSARANLLFS